MNTQAEYLKQLGVDLWLPRAPLAKAAASPAWIYSFTHPAQELSAEAQSKAAAQIVNPPATKGGHTLEEQHAEQRSIAHISEALVEDAASPVSYEGQQSGQIAGTSPAIAHRVAPQPVPRFRFALTRTPRFVIIDQLPNAGPQVLSDAYKKLLVGLVRALGEDTQQMSLPVMLQWPHLAGSKLNQGADEAFKYVQLTLESMQKKSRAEHILMLGSGLSRWVMGEQHSEVARGQLLLHPQKNISCLASATLSEVLRLPDIKRQLWADLQPLVSGASD